jgi:putative ABC transport system ATP-binding protein
MIRAENLSKIYGNNELRVTALDNVSISINDGDFIAIVGSSGAGKSTLLYQLSFLDEPSSGELFFLNEQTSHLNQTQKARLRLNELGYVFQDYALLPELSSIDNVALPMLMQGMKTSLALYKSKQALQRVGLAEKTANFPSQLSGGQQQRVAIARAIAHDPHVIFADEPTANLDSASGRLVMDAFVELNKEGQTIVMVTHEEEYANYAKRIVTMKDGRIVLDSMR